MPEADRLAPFPHPRQTLRVFGHEAAQQEFADAIDSGHCHHAWLICGAEGIGKATVAYTVARYAIADKTERTGQGRSLEVSPKGRAAHQVAALSHPGLLVIRRPYDPKEKRFRTVITVDEVRRLRMFLGHKGGEAAWRVVIVDPVDDMNVAAANALLKSLEEPPPRTLFLLICAQPGRLLPTIRSRCRVLQLLPLSAVDVESAAREAVEAADAASAMSGTDDWKDLVAASGGSVRRCLMLAQSSGLDLVKDLRRIFARLPAVEWSAVHRIADRLSPAAKVTEFELFVSLLLDEVSYAARAGIGLEAPEHSTVLGHRLASTDRVASWAELWESIAADRNAAVALNLDRKSFILETVDRLANAVRA